MTKLKNKLQLILKENGVPEILPKVLEKLIVCVHNHGKDLELLCALEARLKALDGGISVFSTDEMFYITWNAGASAWYRFNDPRSIEEIYEELQSIIKLSRNG